MTDERPGDARARPIIVSALFGEADFAWFDAQRRLYFPPERNQLAAHLTLFHHLPPSCGDELRRRLADAARAPRPAARVSAVMSLGRGVAYRIDSEALCAIRGDLAGAFAPLLTPQDAAGWRPHVTIQNKVTPAEAAALRATLAASFAARAVQIAGLAAWDYMDGPWRLRSTHRFRG